MLLERHQDFLLDESTVWVLYICKKRMLSIKKCCERLLLAYTKMCSVYSTTSFRCTWCMFGGQRCIAETVKCCGKRTAKEIKNGVW